MRKTRNISNLFVIVLIIGVIVVCVGFMAKVWKYSGAFVECDTASFKAEKNMIMGNIYDAKDRLIGGGYQVGENTWTETYAQSMSNVIGAGLWETAGASYTVLGKVGVLYGTKQNFLKNWNPFAGRIGGDIRLSIDAELQNEVTNFLTRKGYDTAGVLVMNYKTGEILISVSLPNFDLNEPQELKFDSDGYVNDKKAFNKVFWDKLMIGSVIKPILFAAVLDLEPNLIDYTYDCQATTHRFGESQIRVDCSNTYHGILEGMDAALPVSCNGYAIKVAEQVDKEMLLEKLKAFGFDNTVSYENQLAFADANFIENSQSEEDLILACIGGANCRSSLLGVGLAYAGIMNDGVIVAPTIIQAESVKHGGELIPVKRGDDRTVCSAETAETIKWLMKLTTEQGTGKTMKCDGYQIATKTGTATGVGTDGSLNNVWAVAGVDTDDENNAFLVVTCVAEVPKDWTSSEVAGGITKEVLNSLLNINEN